MKRVYPKEEVCMACRLCEIACIVEHSEHKDIFWAFRSEKPRQLPKTKVEELGPLSFSANCRHCKEPACIEACITGALYRIDEAHPVLIDKDRCVACWMCIMACPYGSISRDERNGTRHSTKCDLCPDKEIPACVEACPNRALIYEER